MHPWHCSSGRTSPGRPSSRGSKASATTSRAQAPEPRPESAGEIIVVLNKWACRLSTERAPGALETWLRDKASALDRVAPLTISDPLPAEELGALHDDLI